MRLHQLASDQLRIASELTTVTAHPMKSQMSAVFMTRPFVRSIRGDYVLRLIEAVDLDQRARDFALSRLGLDREHGRLYGSR